MSTTYQEKGSLELETTGSAIEAAAGLAVIVLAIVGLSNHAGGVLMPIAAIILGIALVVQGAAVSIEHSRLLAAASSGTIGTIELGGGVTAEMLAGVSVVILGILGVIGLAPAILIAVVIIIAGAAIIVATANFRRLTILKLRGPGFSETVVEVGQAAAAGAASAQLMIGTAAIVLGILALSIAASAAVLTLVGLLILGAGVVISGGTVAGRASSRLFSHF
ncbi:MAG: hypothetical protein ACREFD_07715 [Stellaceae bacterium]